MPGTGRAIPNGAPGAAATKAAPAAQAETDALGAREAGPGEGPRQPEPRRDTLRGAPEAPGKGTGADPASGPAHGGEAPPIGSPRPRWRPCEPPSAPGMARSGRQCQLPPIAAGDGGAGLREPARAALGASGGTCGRRRIHDGPKAQGRVIGGRRTGRTMAGERLGARGKARPRRACGPYGGEAPRHPGDKARQGFGAGPPGLLWPTDAARPPMPAGRLCLGPVSDRLDGAIASWAAPASPDAEVADPMPKAALAAATAGGRRRPVARSGCGRRHRRPGWTPVCAKAGIARPMPRKGRSPGSSRMGGPLGTMEVGTPHGRDWAGAASDGPKERMDACMERHNETRVKRSLGSTSPLQHRQSLGLAAW
jgi:hypothetical protein